MKFRHLLLALLFIQIAHAQDIDSTLVVETEEVVEFQKQSLLKEFQIPYEQDVDRKRLIRLGIQSESAYPGDEFSLFVDLHQKIGMQNSISAGVSLGSGNAGEPFFHSKVEFRHFIGMKKRIENQEQKNNFNGKYLALTFINASELGNRENRISASISDLVYNRPFRQVRNSYTISYGTQLGGILDFALQAGIKEIRPTAIGSDGLIIYDDRTQNTGLSPFIGTRSLISFDFGKKQRNVNCDFVNCFREMNSVWKLGISDLFYADLQEARINLNIDYESRIKESSFSWNSALTVRGGLQSQYKLTGNSIEVQRSFGFEVMDPFEVLLPTFLDEREIVSNGSFRLEQSIRYYSSQKRNIASGKSAKNLNGFYFFGGASLNYGGVQVDDNYIVSRNRSLYYRIGGGLGTQKMIGSKYYTDFSLGFYPITNQNPLNLTNFPLRIGFNFGFIK